MTELEKIFLTSGLTIVGGSMVFVIQRFILEPLNEQNRVLGRITYALYYYGREYGTPPRRDTPDADIVTRQREAANKIRDLAAMLAEASQSVRLYWICVLLGGTPRRKSINDAIGLLTGLSNNFFVTDGGVGMEGVQNSRDADRVLKLLGLKKWGK